MKNLSTSLLLAALTIVTFAVAVPAANWDGTIALGGIYLDQTGDPSTTVETYNVFDGFSVSQIRLTGNLNPRNTFSLNLREVNLNSRKGEFVYRIPGKLRVNSRYDQWRQLFDSQEKVTSERKNWRAGVNWTVAKGGVIRANYTQQKKTGARLGYPDGTESALGDGYDFILQSGLIEGDLRRGPGGVALTYEFTDFNDRNSTLQDRFGQVLAARLHGSAYFWPDKLTHLLRASWGNQELTETGLKMETLTFQYTGVLRPHKHFQFKYNFFARRIDDDGTGFETANFRNNFDLAYFSKYGRVYGGYGYETNDNNLALTNYNTFVAGLTGHWEKKLRGQIEFGTRTKDDQEDRTLLKDIETNRLLATLRWRIIDGLDVGGKITFRQRTFTSISVQSEGSYYNAYGAYEYPGWGSLMADYTYTLDDYDDRVAGFLANSHVATGRLLLDRVDGLLLVAGFTYMDIGKDLDIEKSIMFVEAKYTFANTYFVEVKYNVYNYDDYIVLDRFYTANVVWFNVGYNLKIE